jgi:hypothetical protein
LAPLEGHNLASLRRKLNNNDPSPATTKLYRQLHGPLEPYLSNLNLHYEQRSYDS